MKTNILGTENVLDVAISSRVSRVVCLSTDKAVYPINSMGISKAMMEKVAINKSRTSLETTICVTRYGNVMASRGSVIPQFYEQLVNDLPLTITDPNMTRFMMTLENAVELVLFAFQHGKQGDLLIQKSPSATVETLALACRELFNKPDHPMKTIGTRHGEKLYEVLLSREEMVNAEDLGLYYRIEPDSRDLNYEKYLNTGSTAISTSSEYSSHNAYRLDLNEMKKLLFELPLFRMMLQ